MSDLFYLVKKMKLINNYLFFLNFSVFTKLFLKLLVIIFFMWKAFGKCFQQTPQL